MQEDYQIFKIVVIGDSNTGKTNIALRFSNKEFQNCYQTTIGIQFQSILVKVKNAKLKIMLWDTAGQQRYRAISKQYYKGSAGIILVYDITQPQSYLDLEIWLRLVKDTIDLKQTKIIIIGNKTDLENQRKIPFQRAKQQYQKVHKIKCFQVSAKDNIGIQQAIMALVTQIYNQYNLQVNQNQNSQVQQEQPNRDTVNSFDSLILFKKKQSTQRNSRMSGFPNKNLADENFINRNSINLKAKKKDMQKKKCCH